MPNNVSDHRQWQRVDDENMTTVTFLVNGSYFAESFANLCIMVLPIPLDLLIIAACLIPGVVTGRYKYVLIGHFTCNLHAIFSHLIMYSVFFYWLHYRIPVTVYECSLLRDLLWVMTPLKMIVIALDRYLAICHNYKAKLKWYVFIYATLIIHPHILGYMNLHYGSVITTDLMCPLRLRLNAMEVFTLANIICSTIVALLINARTLMVIVRHKSGAIVESSKKGKRLKRRMSMRRLQDERLIVLFVLMTVSPLVLMTPALLTGFIYRRYGIYSKPVWITVYSLLTLTPFTHSLLTLLMITPIRDGVRMLLRRVLMGIPIESTILSQQQRHSGSLNKINVSGSMHESLITLPRQRVF